MKIFLVGFGVLRHRLTSGREDLETQCPLGAHFGGSFHWRKHKTISVKRQAFKVLHVGLRLVSGLALTMLVHVTSFCPRGNGAVGDDGPGDRKCPAEGHHQPCPVEREP